MGGKAGPKRVVQLRVKWGESRDSRGKAAFATCFGPRARLSGEPTHKNRQTRDRYASMELPPPWFVKASAIWGECLNYRGEGSGVGRRREK